MAAAAAAFFSYEQVDVRNTNTRAVLCSACEGPKIDMDRATHICRGVVLLVNAIRFANLFVNYLLNTPICDSVSNLSVSIYVATKDGTQLLVHLSHYAYICKINDFNQVQNRI